jgi:hypothetical protein
LGKLDQAGEDMNNSLVRECLELILMLGDAMDRKKAEPSMVVSQEPLPLTPQIAIAQPSRSELEAAGSGN